MEYYLPRYCHDRIMGCGVSVVYGLHNQRFMVVVDDKGETDLLSIATLSHGQYTKEEIRTLLFTNVDKLENKLKMLCIGGE